METELLKEKLIIVLDEAIKNLEEQYDKIDKTSLLGLNNANENLGKREALTHTKSLLLGFESEIDFIEGLSNDN